MAGHSKWSQIKRQKGSADAAKSNLWGKLGKRIAVESKKANGDVNAANLRAIVETAKKTNMPKDTIERAIAKGTSLDAASLEQVTYEAYGPGGAAVIITALTDNTNRTLQMLKAIFAKHAIALAAPGAALWAFDATEEGYTPKTTVPLSEDDSDALMKVMELVDGLDDVEGVYTNAE
ncbi:MAG: YebC/PmpR family DNA-binding transcriptional regulator [Minisyncoccia bacterium]